jgi:Uma2 family endonuclease
MSVTPQTRTRPSGDRRLLLRGIRWSTYEALLRDVERSGCRYTMTYDRGRLEIMSPARRHERGKKRLARMVEALTEELNIPIASGGAMTFRRKLKKRGLEPDECYWIANEARIRDTAEIDLERDPPPDLAIEVEHSRSAMNRMEIYAALGFPEIWCYDGARLRIARLRPDGAYDWTDTSACFPFLPMTELARLLAQAGSQDETTWIRGFRVWVRAELAPRLGPPAG